MKKISLVALFTSIIFLCCFFSVFAQTSERIDSFNSDITVNLDSSINVIETIKYNSGGLVKHGIYRDIRLKSYNNKGLSISAISVINENSIPYQFSTNSSLDNISLKIGDPNVTFSGEKTYIVKYKISRAIGYFDKYDEIYWNATGNTWSFPIEKSSVAVHLPSGASILQTSSYCGLSGSKTTCINEGEGKFSYNTELLVGSGMTVAVGFTKGIVVQPNKFWDYVLNHLIYLFLLLPIVIFILMFIIWYRDGRDPKSNRTIIAEYDVPDGLTPLEVSGIVKEKVDTKAISAEIIYLAINGYFKIEKIEEKILFINTDDYLLKRTGDTLPNNVFDKTLLNGLFSSGNEVKMSSLKEKFYTNINDINKGVFNKLILEGAYYKNNPAGTLAKYQGFAGIFLCFGIFIVLEFFRGYGYMPILSVVISSIIISIFAWLMSAKTEKGQRTKEYLLGLKEYLNIAEKDRINFHNAPEKKPETFEKFLPYAMIFGVEKAWAKEFEGIYTEPPKWYSDHNMTTFNAIIFASNLNHFTSYTNHTITSTPPSSGGSGSGGGGFSGGGGGGGGGGSW